MKILEENVGNTSGYWNGHRFFYKILKLQEAKAKIDKWDYVKLKSLCTGKETQSKNTAILLGKNSCNIYF
jgi:hypothetical protein